MDQKVGKWSLRLAEAPFIIESASVVGTKEGQGPLGALFTKVGEDDKFGADSWEEAESNLQREALQLALLRSGVEKRLIRYLFAGDLLGQAMATSFGLKDFDIPLFGVYGACSTCGESLALAAAFVSAGYADYAAAVTSSHFGSAEKQFRFPNEYANQRPMSATWTATGAGAFVLGKKKGVAKITEISTGAIVDYGIKDTMNMGAAMAPAACELIVNHLKDFKRDASYYDRIVTGDLGQVGSQILYKLCLEKGYDISANHEDCGMMIYDLNAQDVGSGGSGCGCSATVFSAHYLKAIKEGAYSRILFVPTGALLSPVSFNEGNSIPGIAHGIVIEGV